MTPDLIRNHPMKSLRDLAIEPVRPGSPGVAGNPVEQTTNQRQAYRAPRLRCLGLLKSVAGSDPNSTGNAIGSLPAGWGS